MVNQTASCVFWEWNDGFCFLSLECYRGISLAYENSQWNGVFFCVFGAFVSESVYLGV